MMLSLGKITGKQTQAEDLVNRIKTNFSELQINKSRRNACYLIWKDPYMTVGGDTFIHDMMVRAGFNLNFPQKEKRYPVITIEDLLTANCKLLLLSSEPYPFKQKHIDQLKKELPGATILLVDGEMFSWYGSRLLHAAEYFTLLHHQIKAIV